MEEAMRISELDITWEPLETLQPYEGNAKRHTHENIDAIAKSIDELGFRNPILAWHDEEGQAVIVAGHGRAEAAKKLGMDKVPIVFVDDLDDKQRRMLTLADNQTTLMTGWDEESLGKELEELADVFSLEDFGFESLDEEAEEYEQVFGEQEGEVPFAEYVNECSNYIVLKYRTDEGWLQAATVLGLESAKSWSTRKDGKQNGVGSVGLGRVVDGEEAFRLITENAKALEG